MSARAAALARLKQQQLDRQTSAAAPCSADAIRAPPQPHLAAETCEDNEAYVERLEAAFDRLNAQPQQQSLRGTNARQPSATQQPASHASSPAQRGSAPAAGGAAASSAARSGRLKQQAAPGVALPAAPEPTSAQSSARSKAASTAAPAWWTGPDNDAGLLCELSDRPLLCSAARWEAAEVVVGCADHALYVVDVRSCKRRRTLFTRTCGHTEWVTCVTYLPEGRILSGGMDGALWLWPAAGVVGCKVSGHTGPISRVATLPFSKGQAVSASYDKSIRLWDVSGSQARQSSCLLGHTAPVLEMAVHRSGLATGDRKGALRVWDLAGGSSSWQQPAAHQGHVTCLAWLNPSSSSSGNAPEQPLVEGPAGLLVSGGQDGCVRVWDTRAREAVAEQRLHVGGQGRGAVGDVVAGGASTGGAILTSGADKTLQLLDPLAGFTSRAAIPLPDFPYSLAAVGGCGVVGCGDGSVLVVDCRLGRVLYGLGANKAAVRCLEVSGDKMVAAGDDGALIGYCFSQGMC